MEIYLKLINEFWTVNKSDDFNSSSITIYFYLLNIWKIEEFKAFDYSDRDLEKELNISRKTIRKSKDLLRNAGLIKFKIEKGSSTKYQIETDVIEVEEPNNVKELPIKPSLKKITAEKKEVPVPVVETKKEPLVKAKIEKPPTKKVQQQVLNVNIPTLDEFLNFAKTIEIYNSNLDYQIKVKYEKWKEDGWKNGYGRPIRNWQTSLKSAMPFFSQSNKPKDLSIPTINKPKHTYNE